MTMVLLSKLIFLHNYKEELLKKFADPNTSYTEYREISDKLKSLNKEIHKIKNNVPNHSGTM